MATVNLWPVEITADSGLEGPIVVLKEQAALLGQTTKNLVEAQVESDSADDSSNFVDRFIVYSSVINYRYELFSVHYPFEFYPAVIFWNGYPDNGYWHPDAEVYVEATEPGQNTVDSQEGLIEQLKVIFSHERTIRIIHAIMARSRE